MDAGKADLSNCLHFDAEYAQEVMSLSIPIGRTAMKVIGVNKMLGEGVYDAIYRIHEIG